MLKGLKRIGAERCFESFDKIRLVRRPCAGFKLEVQDLNSICNSAIHIPAKFLTCTNVMPALDVLDKWLLSSLLVPRNIRNFSFYSPVNFEKVEEGKVCLCVRYGGYLWGCSAYTSKATDTISPKASGARRNLRHTKFGKPERQNTLPSVDR